MPPLGEFNNLTMRVVFVLRYQISLIGVLGHEAFWQTLPAFHRAVGMFDIQHIAITIALGAAIALLFRFLQKQIGYFADLTTI